MKDEPRPVHELEHSAPTVIHRPDEDMTVLARWLHRGMEQGPRFWVWVAGVVLALAALAFLSSGLAASRSATGQAWIELVSTKSSEDQVKEQLRIAEANPKTSVADWARLRAAFGEYANGLIDLNTPGKKETAGPRLKRALELFRQVADEAPKDSSQAIGAALGVARTLEARNELPEAIKQYKLVADRWAGTPEAKQAEALARALADPESARFYEQLYAYKPPTGTAPSGPVDLPPGGSRNFDLRSLVPGGLAPPGLDPPPGRIPGAPAPPGLAPPPEKSGAETKGELPADPFSPPK